MLIKIKPLQFEEKLINPMESIMPLDCQSVMVNDSIRPVDISTLKPSQFTTFSKIYGPSEQNVNLFMKEIEH